MVFYAIAVLTQMDIDNGNILFGIEPVTKKFSNIHLWNITNRIVQLCCVYDIIIINNSVYS